MVRRLQGRHPLGLIAIGVVITLVLSGTALAVTDTSFTYSTVQTGYLMIGLADLIPETDASADSYFISAVVAHGSGGGACFNAPLHLPQGARMTSVRTSYLSHATGDPSLNLQRSNPVTGASDYLIFRSIADDAGTRTYVNDVVPANLGLVNNALFTYTYRVCVGIGDLFYGARIAYQYSSAGD